MLQKTEQQIVSTGGQAYVRCSSCGFKQSLQPSDLSDPTSIVCSGPGCENTFSAKEGLKHAIVSDNDFMAWCFISDTMISGQDAITIGTAKEIRLEAPLKAAKKVFIMQVTPLEPGILAYFEHKFIPPDNLIILSSGANDIVGTECQVKWVVYADTKGERKEAWREYLQRAKESLINEDYQSAIVEAEIAVEVTIAAVLWELLTKRKKLAEDVAEWILNKVQAASERVKRVAELAIGKKISDINPIVYKSWVRDVAQKRNRIVHQGETATKEDAISAIEAAFEFIWLLLELIGRHPVKVES
ncbi:MAG: hypothetical protein COW32_06265 [Candidatus Aquicultor secundus]|uniref:Apea-like HEPN domain-containing protein n=1 Tax=Candidatus Aquicultor secundus TaxID=1973895 RepID=A0A2M7T548_9ACTN|nr:hypothetical protein [Candidatus Aquicultor secundus]NCO65422.1 hypothetical protein [Solirubrobacter sp.]OIO86498.1 MAG: hypothetical protein AUK32_05455 [Candidatus Aquicultor secundus]PIU26443.1 MAG: hypothetical protein COT10_08685 [Candidatus Aquicultor secundus]PIW22126.1 MAG: hypothetical protein COW32_06265 [Candidatus Aquicultor secundus]PIX52426.1 MAG: hypothetical protein COZ51_04260 [Candidatus Aquicultor secundus]